jgi:hypothetical protein
VCICVHLLVTGGRPARWVDIDIDVSRGLKVVFGKPYEKHGTVAHDTVAILFIIFF